MTKAFTAFTVALVGYLAFMGAAFAGNAVAPGDESILDMIKPVFDAVVHGQWWLGASLALILAVTALKRYAHKIPKFGPKLSAAINGDIGQPITVLALSFGGAIATAAAAQGTVFVMSAALAWTALKVAVGAAGGYSLLKSLLAPLIVKLGAKAPAWMKPLFDMVLWAFSKPTAVEKAEKAGDDAVAANPPTGASKSDIAEI